MRRRALLPIALHLMASCDLSACSAPADMRAHELSLATETAGSFAAWHGGTNDGSAIFVQGIDDRGELVGTPFLVSDGKRLAYEPDLILADGRLVVTWYERDAQSGALTAWLAALTPRGERQWRMRLGGGGDARNPVVRRIGERLHVAWIEQSASDPGDNRSTIWHQQFSLTGEPLGTPEEIGRANRDTWNLNATVSGTQMIVSYDAALTTKAHELQMLVVDDRGVLHRTLSPDDGHASLYPDLQVSHSGQAALTWFDEKDGNQEVYLIAAPLSALEAGRAPPATRISHSAADSIGAYLAWNGPVLGLAWSDETDGERRIFAGTFDAEGKALGPVRQFRPSSGSASIPTIRADRSGFLLAWNDYETSGDGGHGGVQSSVARIAMLPISR